MATPITSVINSQGLWAEANTPNTLFSFGFDTAGNIIITEIDNRGNKTPFLSLTPTSPLNEPDASVRLDDRIAGDIVVTGPVSVSIALNEYTSNHIEIRLVTKLTFTKII